MYATKTNDPSVKEFAKRAFPGYKGRTYKLRVTDHRMHLQSYWSGGSRSWFQVIRLADMQAVSIPENGSGFTEVDKTFGHAGLPIHVPAPGFAVVEHSHFSGKDCGLTVHIHPDNATKFLPAASEVN